MVVTNAETAAGAAVAVGNFTLDLKRQQLLRDGAVVELRPKSFDVLRYLSVNSGRVVSKDEMFAAVWPGVTVSDNSLVQCISEIRQVLGEEGQALIRTVPRRGYMFVGDEGAGSGSATVVPVRMSRLAVWQSQWATVWRAKTTRIGLGLAVALCAGLLAFLALERAGQKTGLIRSVAILPFDQLAVENTDSGSFGRGLTDLIVVRLSNLGTLKVHPTSAAASRLTQGQSALEIGRNLGVDAVLEGRVYNQHERLRGTAQLLRVSDGETVWSDRFDEAASDIFRAQDTYSVATRDLDRGEERSSRQGLFAPRQRVPRGHSGLCKGPLLARQAFEVKCRRRSAKLRDRCQARPEFCSGLRGAGRCFGSRWGIRYNRAPTGLRPGQERGIEGIGNPAELGIAACRTGIRKCSR